MMKSIEEMNKSLNKINLQFIDTNFQEIVTRILPCCEFLLKNHNLQRTVPLVHNFLGIFKKKNMHHLLRLHRSAQWVE